MSRIKVYVAPLTLLAAVGCASGPEVAHQAPAAATPVAAADVSGSVASAPVTVLYVNELVATQAPPVICRDILKRGSNVHVTQCGTAEEWKRFKRREADDAKAMVRTMQGGRYR